jgi:hypothetical protein
MALATIDSVATTKTLCSNLREILMYCATIKGDINLLHSYFDNNYSQIIAQGATVNNPVDILFTVYSVVPCAHFCLYIKGKHDDYTDGMATYTHEQLILLASNKYNLLVQEGIFGAKSLKEEKIIAMQAELTALKGQFVLAPNLQCAASNKKDGEKKDHVKKDQQKGKKKNKKILRIRRSRSKWRNSNACLPTMVSCTKRSTAIGSTTGAPTTWYGATILLRIVAWARNARRIRTRDATHMQLWLMPPPLANLSGLISSQICIATWQTNDSSDWHGLGGPLSGSCPWPRHLLTMDIRYSPMSSLRFYHSSWHGSALSLRPPLPNFFNSCSGIIYNSLFNIST